MNLDFFDMTPEEQSFRSEVRDFYEKNLNDELRRAAELTTWAFAEFEYGRQWQKILHQRGWGAPMWPIEYGGPGWTRRQLLIWETEKAKAQPPEVMRMGRDYAAPCIMAFGTQAQKDFFLPRILSGDDWWAQGFSEPGAGSDLAALQLSAKPEGDSYILNGSKIWTTFAHHANRIFMLVRTAKSEKKQQGITFLLVDLDSPGIEIHPIINIAGEHDFNQVFFNDVRVPMDRRLGEENQGWAVARHLLRFEHGIGIVRQSAELHRRAGWVKQLAASEPDGYGGRLIDDRTWRRTLAKLEIDVEAASFAAIQLFLSSKADEAPGPTAELLNIRIRDLDQALTELAAQSVAYSGLVDQPETRKVSHHAPLVGPAHALTPVPIYLAQRGATIAGGTPDIHRNNLWKQLLR